MGDRPRHMVSVGKQGSTIRKSRLASSFKIRTFSKKSKTKVLVLKAKVILVTLGSTQSSSEGEMTCIGEPDQSTTPPGSSPLATFSIGCNTWITPTDKGSIVEELKQKMKGTKKTKDTRDEEEGSQRRRGRTR